MKRHFLSASVLAVISGILPVSQTIAQANPISNSVIYVNSRTGSDNNSGQVQSPLKTITVALDRALPNSIIVLAPGTYSVETGEVFPIQLKPTVTLQGDPRDRGQNVMIRGGDFFLSRTFARQNVTILGANRAVLTGVTVTNPNPQGYGLWMESSSPIVIANTFTGSTHDGASIVGNSTPSLQNNYFYQNGANGVTVYGTSRPDIYDNIFERTGFGVNIAQNSAPKLLGNRITQNKDGIVVQGSAQPLIRNNVIDNNERDGIVSIAQSRPNLGTVADPGNNTFLGNRQFDINAQRTTYTISAFGNQVSEKTIGRLDLLGTAVLEPTSTLASTRLPQSQATGAINIPVPMAQTTPLPVARRQLMPVQNSSAVNIPVPMAQTAPLPVSQRQSRAIAVPPVQSAPLPLARSSRPLPTLRINALIRPSGAIPIQVPQAQPAVVQQPIQQPIQQPTRIAAVSGLLPVPRATPPVGNTAGTDVKIWRGGRSGGVSQAASLGYRFRVIVRANTELEQAQVRSLVTDAFSLRGRGAMQAGAFRDHAEADELLQILLNQGLQASIEQI